MTVLRKIYGSKIPDFEQSLMSRWSLDPFSKGSYTHIPVGARPKYYEAIAQPIQNRVFFAGEATTQDYPGTVHGAFLTGVREAKRISGLG